MTDRDKEMILKSQQGELDGVETYKMLAEVVHNEDDVKAFKELAADEGRHAAVFKKYTGEVLKPNKTVLETYRDLPGMFDTWRIYGIYRPELFGQGVR